MTLLFIQNRALLSWPGYGATRLITFTAFGNPVWILTLSLHRHMSRIGQSHRNLQTLHLVPLQNSLQLSRRSGLSAPFLARHCLAGPGQGDKCSWWATIGCAGLAWTCMAEWLLVSQKGATCAQSAAAGFPAVVLPEGVDNGTALDWWFGGPEFIYACQPGSACLECSWWFPTSCAPSFGWMRGLLGGLEERWT